MRKLILSLCIISTFIFTGCNSIEPKGNNEAEIVEPIETIVTNKTRGGENGFALETDNVWTPTFQLCWNEFIKLVGTNKIEYVESNPLLANELNNQKFSKEDLNKDDYYISVDKATLKHKKQIEDAIWKKFNEKSDILKKLQYEKEPTNKWLIYSILLKKFPFIAKFDNLPSNYFNNYEPQKYKYFGFMKGIARNDVDSGKNEKELAKTIDSLFYINDNDFALKIKDKTGKEEMILYLTNSDSSFDEIYNEILEKATHKQEYNKERIAVAKQKYPDKEIIVNFSNYYKIPYLHIDRTFKFEDLIGKPIKDKDYPKFLWIISQALQTIKFDMDNTGAKLKSEAVIIAAKETARATTRHYINLDNLFYFDRPFVIFLKETNKNKPYFAARIKNGEYLVKE